MEGFEKMKECGKQLKDCPRVQSNKMEVWLALSDNGTDKVELSFHTVSGK